jgi:hypothetical protein
MSFRNSLGALTSIPQWFVWRLVWDADEQKYKKTPCALDGNPRPIDAGDSRNWCDFDNVDTYVRSLRERAAILKDGVTYAHGFRLTADAGYFLLDLDKCVTDGCVLNQHASAMVQAFPGAMVEISSSGNGVHVIGRTAAGIPPHRSRDVHGLHYELYSDLRGICFAIDGEAEGNADTECDAALASVIETYFPPRAVVDGPSVRAEWRGPADDDELIRRMLNAKQGAAAAFGAKASLRQLWMGEAEPNSEHDMALAAHLAFWTGCDAERMERLMRRSGMVREKWNTHRPGGTYLTYTIANAIAGCTAVYQEPERSVAAQTELYGPVPPVHTQMVAAPVITDEQSARLAELMDQVTACPTLEAMHNDVIPAIRAAMIPPAISEKLARAVNKQLDFFDAKLPIGKVRALINPPIIAGARDVPSWVMHHCYVLSNDKFFNLDNGMELTMQGFVSSYGKHMPMTDSGRRENAAEWALHRWSMQVVDRVSYRPDQPPYFVWDGLEHANLYSPNSVPDTATAYTAAGVAGIEAFKSLLWDMCARREPVYLALLHWLAFAVQQPGRKIRWSPIIRGVPGDGKSIIGAVLRAVMGGRNVSVTGNSSLKNSGGFNDWAVRAAVNVIEEIHLTGRERHALYNAMKEFVTNNVVNINPKGKTTHDVFNVTNHLALSNHNDALPLEPEDRRWFVIFTPWESIAGMRQFCGLGADEFQARFDAIDHAYKTCAGELRAWLLSVDVDMKVVGSAYAPLTPEKRRMMASSRDDVETIAAQIIEEGSYGVTSTVLSSGCLTGALKIRGQLENFDVPKGVEVNRLLTRLGFSQVEKVLKWDGKAHRVWIINGISDDNDALRSRLDASKPN